MRGKQKQVSRFLQRPALWLPSYLRGGQTVATGPNQVEAEGLIPSRSKTNKLGGWKHGFKEPLAVQVHPETLGDCLLTGNWTSIVRSFREARVAATALASFFFGKTLPVVESQSVAIPSLAPESVKNLKIIPFSPQSVVQGVQCVHNVHRRCTCIQNAYICQVYFTQ